VAKPLLPDGLWEIIEPLLPPQVPSPKGGRPPVPHRAALTGILFVLKTGIGWEDLPAEMGCGSGMTCWRRLRDWQLDGTWDKLHAVLLERLDEAGRIDWSRAAIDSSSVRAVFGGRAPAPAARTAAKAGASTT
jgi:transposase